MRLLSNHFLAALVLGTIYVGSFLGATKESLADSGKEKAPRSAPGAPEVHKGDGWAMAAPADWTTLPDAPPPRALYLIGDGRAGVPLFDGTLAPLKAGLLVELFPKGELTPKDRLQKDLKELKGNRMFKLRREPQTREIQLADGTKAHLFEAEFERLDNDRLSWYRKVYCSDGKDKIIVATAFLTSGLAGGAFVKRIALTDFLEAHLTSLVLDARKLDLEKLKPVYAKHPWEIGAALKKMREGNRLMNQKEYADAAKVFREVLQTCEHISAAHNGLAWSLLHGKEESAKSLEEALRHARKAVEETEEQDAAALDTLALALYRGGDKAQAVKTIRKALRLQPEDRDLQRRLQSFEKKP